MEKLISFLNEKKDNINIETYKTLVLTFDEFKTMSDLENFIPKEVENHLNIQISTSSLEDVKFASVKGLKSLIEIAGFSFSELENLKLTVIVEKAKIVDCEETYFFKDKKSLEKELLYLYAKESLKNLEGNKKELENFLYGKKSYLTLEELQWKEMMSYEILPI